MNQAETRTFLILLYGSMDDAIDGWVYDPPPADSQLFALMQAYFAYSEYKTNER